MPWCRSQPHHLRAPCLLGICVPLASSSLRYSLSSCPSPFTPLTVFVLSPYEICDRLLTKEGDLIRYQDTPECRQLDASIHAVIELVNACATDPRRGSGTTSVKMGSILLLHPPFTPFAIVTPVTASYRLLLHHLLTIRYLSFSSLSSSSPSPSHCAPRYSLEVSSSCLSFVTALRGPFSSLCRLLPPCLSCSCAHGGC